MYLTPIVHVLALYFFFFLAHAIPIKPLESFQRLALRNRASYSVVAVDGSSPYPSSAATVAPVRTVTQVVDDMKTVTALPRMFTSSIKTIVSTQVVTELARPIGVMPFSTVTSISTLRITTVQLKKSVSTLTQQAPEAIRSIASFHEVAPPGTIKAPPEKSSPTPFPIGSVGGHSDTASTTASAPVVASISSTTQYLSSEPSSSTYTSQPIISTVTFDTGMWHSSYPYLNATSAAISHPCKTAASTDTAAVPELLRP